MLIDGVPADQMDHLIRLLFPFAFVRYENRRAERGRFAYYTSADTAVKVIKDQTMWMRKTATMNDSQEVEHGIGLLLRALDAEPGTRLSAALEACGLAGFQHMSQMFRAFLPEVRKNTYITCLSEHDPSEDLHGRLSMWRAYGGQNGVALIFNGDVIYGNSDDLGVYASPVEYLDDARFLEAIDTVIRNIEENQAFIRELPHRAVRNALMSMLHGAVICTKHLGFAEEKEWRVYLAPYFHENHQLECHVEVVRGTPQDVMKLPLTDGDFNLKRILDRVIIGPCDFPDVAKGAFERLLADIGVENPAEKIFTSGIPLRHF